MRDTIAIEAIVVVSVIFFASLAPAYISAKAPVSVDVNSQISPSQALSFLPNVPGYNLTYIYQDTQAQDILSANAILVYSYTAPNGSSLIADVQITPGYHSPASSIVDVPTGRGTVPQVYDNSPAYITISGSASPLAAQFIAFDNPQSNATEIILWWNLRSYFNLGSFYDYRNVQVQLIGLPQSPSQIASMEKSMLPLASRIAAFWSPQLTYSVLQTTLKNSSLEIAGLTLIPAIFVAGRDGMKSTRSKKSTEYVHTVLKTEEEKDLFEAISSLGGHGGTLQKILFEYKKKTSGDISFERALMTLTYLEHLGLVRVMIIDVSNEPIQVWQPIVYKSKLNVQSPPVLKSLKS